MGGWSLLRSTTVRGADDLRNCIHCRRRRWEIICQRWPNALLTEAGSRLNIEALASRILDSSQFANLPVTKRLVLLVEKLNEMHYQARWEAGAEGPRVIFGRCPYAKVIEGHPELCKMDTAMVGFSLGRPIIQLQKNEAGGRGACPFLFRVG